MVHTRRLEAIPPSRRLPALPPNSALAAHAKGIRWMIRNTYNSNLNPSWFQVSQSSEVANDRYIAVDPYLILKRVTWGLFFDLFERDGIAFSNRFGNIFSRLVGELLQSVHPQELLWCDSANDTPGSGKPQAKVGKRGDWAFKGPEYTVLFECKALQPTLELRHFGSQPSIDELRKRIVCGLEQVIRQGQSMQQGGWANEGLPPAPFVSVLISYGQFYARSGCRVP